MGRSTPRSYQQPTQYEVAETEPGAYTWQEIPIPPWADGREVVAVEGTPENRAAIIDLIQSEWPAVRAGGEELVREFGFDSVLGWLQSKIEEYVRLGGSRDDIKTAILDVMRKERERDRRRRGLGPW